MTWFPCTGKTTCKAPPRLSLKRDNFGTKFTVSLFNKCSKLIIFLFLDWKYYAIIPQQSSYSQYNLFIFMSGLSHPSFIIISGKPHPSHPSFIIIPGRPHPYYPSFIIIRGKPHPSHPSLIIIPSNPHSSHPSFIIIPVNLHPYLLNILGNPFPYLLNILVTPVLMSSTSR